MPHPPYSLDLAPNDFVLFPRMKSVLKRHRFNTVNAIKYNNYITTESRQDLLRTTQGGWNLENRATPEITTMPPTATDIVAQLAEHIQDITASSLR
ncbi:hypothetical protein LAZ67_10001851 [Cordylochernes scorpioides]|uniref:Histone-lysine N-methyltransferase SETMAR n=1 Tax=Cordylochernes scorpioides TaxID=51811 RepID=A0ABY6KYE1_9ARAC|nr:hypothetical protein LAZ67_10001851 [Cordylochernes scorpioides]